MDDAEEFRGLAAALTILGVTQQEQEGLWRLLAALLHIGNIQFIDADGDEARAAGPHLVSPLIDLEKIAKMTGLPASRLMTSMRKKVQ